MKVDEIIEHLVDISKGGLRLDEASIMQMEDPKEQQLLMGLLILSDEIRYKREKLEDTLKLNELLVQEMHHRIKNNLQIISSILSLEANEIEDPESILILNSCRDRIHSIAYIHQLLYSRTNSTVNLSDYLGDLVAMFNRSTQTLTKSIQVIFQSSEKDLEVDLDDLAPIGLILNEIITNCYKYTNHREATISVFLEQYDKKTRISICSPSGSKNINRTKGIGKELIQSFAEQISAKLTIEQKDNSGYEYQLQLNCL